MKKIWLLLFGIAMVFASVNFVSGSISTGMTQDRFYLDYCEYRFGDETANSWVNGKGLFMKLVNENPSIDSEYVYHYESYDSRNFNDETSYIPILKVRNVKDDNNVYIKCKIVFSDADALYSIASFIQMFGGTGSGEGIALTSDYGIVNSYSGSDEVKYTELFQALSPYSKPNFAYKGLSPSAVLYNFELNGFDAGNTIGDLSTTPIPKNSELVVFFVRDLTAEPEGIALFHSSIQINEVAYGLGNGMFYVDNDLVGTSDYELPVLKRVNDKSVVQIERVQGEIFNYQNSDSLLILNDNDDLKVTMNILNPFDYDLNNVNVFVRFIGGVGSNTGGFGNGNVDTLGSKKYNPDCEWYSFSSEDFPSEQEKTIVIKKDNFPRGKCIAPFLYGRVVFSKNGNSRQDSFGLQWGKDDILYLGLKGLRSEVTLNAESQKIFRINTNLIARGGSGVIINPRDYTLFAEILKENGDKTGHILSIPVEKEFTSDGQEEPVVIEFPIDSLIADYGVGKYLVNVYTIDNRDFGFKGGRIASFNSQPVFIGSNVIYSDDTELYFGTDVKKRQVSLIVFNPFLEQKTVTLTYTPPLDTEYFVDFSSRDVILEPWEKKEIVFDVVANHVDWETPSSDSFTIAGDIEGELDSTITFNLERVNGRLDLVDLKIDEFKANEFGGSAELDASWYLETSSDSVAGETYNVNVQIFKEGTAVEGYNFSKQYKIGDVLAIPKGAPLIVPFSWEGLEIIGLENGAYTATLTLDSEDSIDEGQAGADTNREANNARNITFNIRDCENYENLTACLGLDGDSFLKGCVWITDKCEDCKLLTPKTCGSYENQESCENNPCNFDENCVFADGVCNVKIDDCTYKQIWTTPCSEENIMGQYRLDMISGENCGRDGELVDYYCMEYVPLPFFGFMHLVVGLVCVGLLYIVICVYRN